MPPEEPLYTEPSEEVHSLACPLSLKLLIQFRAVVLKLGSVKHWGSANASHGFRKGVSGVPQRRLWGSAKG